MKGTSKTFHFLVLLTILNIAWVAIFTPNPLNQSFYNKKDLESSKEKKYVEKLDSFDVGNLINFENSKTFSKKKLAVIVPVRGCLANVLKFVPHLSKFLNAREIPFHIFMIQQVDSLRFSRAYLLNVGYLYTKDKFDYTVQHDADLLPLNPKLSYEYPDGCAFHLMNSFFHPAVYLRDHVIF